MKTHDENTGVRSPSVPLNHEFHRRKWPLTHPDWREALGKQSTSVRSGDSDHIRLFRSYEICPYAFEGTRNLVTYIDQIVLEVRRRTLFRTPVQFPGQLLFDSDVHFCCEHAEIHLFLMHSLRETTWRHDFGIDRDS